MCKQCECRSCVKGFENHEYFCTGNDGCVLGKDKKMTTTPTLEPRAPIGTVIKARVLDKEFPCVKVSETSWIVKDGLKYLKQANQACSKSGDDIFLEEIGE